MVTFTDFVITLLASVLELVVAFVDVALNDPPTTVSSLFDNVFILLTVSASVCVALGTLGAELGIIGVGSSSGRPPQRK